MKSEKNPQPLKINCFHCQKEIAVKYVRASRDYSNKNNWEYWTEQPQYKDFYICDDCLVKLYRQHKWDFRQLIPNKVKRILLRQYMTNGTINGQAEAVFITNRENNFTVCPRCGAKKKKKQLVSLNQSKTLPPTELRQNKVGD